MAIKKLKPLIYIDKNRFLIHTIVFNLGGMLNGVYNGFLPLKIMGIAFLISLVVGALTSIRIIKR